MFLVASDLYIIKSHIKIIIFDIYIKFGMIFHYNGLSFIS